MAASESLWKEIRAEYIEYGTRYAVLAEKYGVPISTLKKRAMREQWGQLKADADAEALERLEPATEPVPPNAKKVQEWLVPAMDEIVEEKKNRLARFMEITDAMMDRIADALADPEVTSPYSIKMLASALRDLREMQGLNRTALDIEEQRARIDRIRSQTHIVDTEESGGVLILPVIDNELVPPEDPDG